MNDLLVTTIRDIAEVILLAEKLANDDPLLADLFAPIIQDFKRQAVRDVQDFYRGREF
jgi:hypothetical protein